MSNKHQQLTAILIKNGPLIGRFLKLIDDEILELIVYNGKHIAQSLDFI